MPRHYDDWLKAFIEYSSVSEAPLTVYFWVGVSTIAGALRRQVWIDQVFFNWYANFYVLLVAPPAIISKTTSTRIGLSLLREIPGVKFGPNAVTWQKVATIFASSTEEVLMPDNLFHPMSAITIESSELGNLLDPKDRDMVDLLITLWDGQTGTFVKSTKTQGDDEIINPWLNIIACTTPSWLAANFPEVMIGGGFVSRCILVHAEEKRQPVAYLSESIPPNHYEVRQKLIEDLEHISQIKGIYKLDRAAIRWGTDWYNQHVKKRPAGLANERFAGYLARKQTHIHKLAMILAAAKRDDLIITAEELIAADQLASALEASMPKVFAQIGRSPLSKNADELLAYVRAYQEIEYVELFKAMFRIFPSTREFDLALTSLRAAGLLRLDAVGGKMIVRIL